MAAFPCAYVFNNNINITSSVSEFSIVNPDPICTHNLLLHLSWRETNATSWQILPWILAVFFGRFLCNCPCLACHSVCELCCRVMTMLHAASQLRQAHVDSTWTTKQQSSIEKKDYHLLPGRNEVRSVPQPKGQLVTSLSLSLSLSLCDQCTGFWVRFA
jgi:hypothetical protein